MAAELVLIVNERRPIADAIAYVVEDLGHTALITNSGFDALEYVRTQHPALIVTEYLLRRMTGAQLIAILRSAYGRRCPPIVLFSASEDEQIRAAQADAVMTMPWDLQQLEDLLERFLGTNA